MRLFYLSFATDTAFLGACVVRALDVPGAWQKVTALGINPGGQAAAWDVTDLGDPPYPVDALLSEADMAAIDGGPGVRLGQMGEADRERLQSRMGGVICDGCNDA